MQNFEYEIRLNDEGRPYIHLPKEFEDKPEHIFMVFEMVRYSLYDLLSKNEEKLHLKEETIKQIAEAGNTIGQISDEYANILKGMMER